MFKKLLLIVVFISSAGYLQASNSFEPEIVYSNGDQVCKLALDHYKKIFLSNSQSTKSIAQSEDVYFPSFESRSIEGVYGSIKIAQINIDNMEKLIVYYSRALGWRGDIYTGYMIDSLQLSELEQQLKSESTPPYFYPMGSLRYGSDFSWWENLPFRYDNKWYVLGDFGDFYRHGSLRDVYQIFAQSEPVKVCTIKIFENFNKDISGQKFPFFSAYQKSLETIMLSDSDCGTSRPGARAESNGKLLASIALVRPWAVSLWADNTNHMNRKIYHFQKKHFDDWKYQDPWSYREQETLLNLKRDAISELVKYYKDKFSYSEIAASEKATNVIESMPGYYYSLGIYYDDDKDFSAFQNLVDGTFTDWQNLPDKMKMEHGSLPNSVLTLLVDTPQNIKKLPSALKPEAIVTNYKKDLLMFAAHMNNYASVKHLINSNWPINNVTDLKNTFCGPNMERTHRSALTYAVENSSIHIIKLLVSAGADIEIKDSKGNGLDFYIKNNPRFSDEEKNMGFKKLLKKYESYSNIKPSFNCNQKLNKIETLICSDDSLSIYDQELSSAYKKAIVIDAISKLIKDSQIYWIKKRNETCSDFEEDIQIKACISRQTRARIRYLEYVAYWFNRPMGLDASTKKNL